MCRGFFPQPPGTEGVEELPTLEKARQTAMRKVTRGKRVLSVETSMSLMGFLKSRDSVISLQDQIT